MKNAKASAGTLRTTQEATPTPGQVDNDAIDDVFEATCRLLETGMTQRVACRQAGVDPSTLWRWANASESRRTRYAHARDCQARALADETIEIGDEATPEGAQVAKLRVDSRKWLASKLLPREFGDRLEVEARAVVGSVDFGRLSDDQIRRIASGEAIGSVLSSAVADHARQLSAGDCSADGSLSSDPA